MEETGGYKQHLHFPLGSSHALQQLAFQEDEKNSENSIHTEMRCLGILVLTPALYPPQAGEW